MEKRKCYKCNEDFLINEKSRYIKKYCSLKCANSRIQTDEINKKRSISIKKVISEGKLELPKYNQGINGGKDLSKWEKRKCLNCIVEYSCYKNSLKKYCSKKCSYNSPNKGGYREGTGKSKTGYYKGIYCGSTWELAWTIYRIDHNLPVERFGNGLKSKNNPNQKSYFPDFLLDNDTIVEIKGYERKGEVERKNKIAEEYGYKVIVLRKKDLEKEFKWIEEKYNKKYHLETLYDGYKPEYKYFCSTCKVEFSRFKKAKTNTVFCSRKCVRRIKNVNFFVK